jgi:hypothetical protein
VVVRWPRSHHLRAAISGHIIYQALSQIQQPLCPANPHPPGWRSLLLRGVLRQPHTANEVRRTTRTGPLGSSDGRQSPSIAATKAMPLVSTSSHPVVASECTPVAQITPRCENALMNAHRRSRTRGTKTCRQVGGWGRADQTGGKDGMVGEELNGRGYFGLPPSTHLALPIRRGHMTISTRGAEPSRKGGRVAVHSRVDILSRKGIARRGAGRLSTEGARVRAGRGLAWACSMQGYRQGTAHRRAAAQADR